MQNAKKKKRYPQLFKSFENDKKKRGDSYHHNVCFSFIEKKKKAIQG